METALRLVCVEGEAMSDCPDTFSEEIAKGIEWLSDRLVESMHTDGYWEGCLSSSALSTATAISTLSLANDEEDQPRILAGIRWLSEHSNPEGGWGDTADSPSNLATTLLVISAGRLANVDCPRFAEVAEKAVEYLKRQGLEMPAGANESQKSRSSVTKAIQREYGEDRTFAVPILMNCALAGLVDWADIPGLPFELAVLPPRFFKALRLHVVSYAMPALIAIGLLLNSKNPPGNVLKRWIRRATASRVLKILHDMQPSGGGFLEAVPLTSFVTMGLVPLFGKSQPTAAACLGFLRNAQRADGSWPIDSNLSVWLTTSAVTALGTANQLAKIDGNRLSRWIAERQYATPHPFTHAAPGGWAWTHLAGGVPDADDTSGAIIALAELNDFDKDAVNLKNSVAKGIQWLLDLQNGDGGWPTFCRGWGKLPFDRSSPDITAHVLRSFGRIESIESVEQGKVSQFFREIRKGLDYLTRSQQPDGSWIPLWFGNQAVEDRINPVVGTSLVLRAMELFRPKTECTRRGLLYLIQVQNADGGWGGAAAVPSTLEETALAVSALAPWGESAEIGKAIGGGVRYLLQEMENQVDHPHPIGLYFSHLWYAEKLYPVIWTLDALGRVCSCCSTSPAKPGEGTSPQNP